MAGWQNLQVAHDVYNEGGLSGFGHASPDLSIGAITEAIGRAWWCVMCGSTGSVLGWTWRHVRLSLMVNLPQIIRSVPCRPYFEIIFF
jgi:hypothetical protein